MGRFDLMRIGIDEQTRQDSCLPQTILPWRAQWRCSSARSRPPSVVISFGFSGNQSNRVGLNVDRDLQHLFGRGHLEIQVGGDCLSQKMTSRDPEYDGDRRAGES